MVSTGQGIRASEGATPRGLVRSRSTRRLVFLLSLMAAVSVAPSPLAEAATADVIVLPGATSAEGIAAGRGSTFYAGDLFTGDIFRGDVRRGTAETFIHAPAGRQATGMIVDVAHHVLIVTGGFTGQAYFYDLDTGATLATYQLGAAGPL